MLFPEKITIPFYPTVSTCEQCENPLHVLKTNTKTLVTMEIGEIETKETVLYCPSDSSVYRSEELRKLAPLRGTFGFDVLVEVGNIVLNSMNGSISNIVENTLLYNVPEINFGSVASFFDTKKINK